MNRSPVPQRLPKPSPRRLARETALRVLYTMEVGQQTVENALTDTLENKDLDEIGVAFARHLVECAVTHQRSIDASLNRVAAGFPVGRQNVVDRNILRLAAAELFHEASDAPPGAVVNEAVELARKYSTKDSPRFVNGVLGALVRESLPNVDLSEADANAAVDSEPDESLILTNEEPIDA